MSNLKKIIFLQFTLDFIGSAYLVISSWTIFVTTGSSTLTGLYISLGFLPSLLLNIYIGAIVDRWNTKKMITCSLALTLASISLLFFYFFLKSILILFITQMLIQLAGSIFRPSIQVYITELFAPEKLKYIFTKSASLTILGGVLGTFIASQLISISELYITLLIFIIITINFIVSFTLPSPSPKKKPFQSSIHQDILDGLKYIKTNSIFLKLFAILGTGQIITHCTTGFLAAYTYDTFSNQSTLYGYLQITLTMGGVLLGFMTKSFLIKIEAIFSKYAFPLLTLCLFICVFSTHFILIGFCLFSIGMLTTWIRSHFQAVQQIHTDIGFNGKMASFRMIINQGSVVLISPLLGLIGSNFGTNYIFFALSIITGLGCFMVLKMNKTPL